MTEETPVMDTSYEKMEREIQQAMSIESDYRAQIEKIRNDPNDWRVEPEPMTEDELKAIDQASLKGRDGLVEKSSDLPRCIAEIRRLREKVAQLGGNPDE